MTAKNPELEVFNPFDGSKVGSVKINSANEIEEMLELGFQLYKENPKGLNAHQRIQVLHKASRRTLFLGLAFCQCYGRGGQGSHLHVAHQ